MNTAHRLPSRSASRILSLLVLAVGLSAEISEMQRVDLKPCLYVATDEGASAKERSDNARRWAKHIAATSTFFLDVFGLKPQSFVEYAELYHRPPESPFDQWIRIRVFRRHQEFLEDFQKRYDSKAIPGAFFGIIRDKDEYGEFQGPWFREIATHSEGIGDEQILRHIYHEMGHLFMRTYMLYPCEVPSWIEEGTAELFQYRKGNGTNPEPTRIERLGWLREMVDLNENEIGRSVPWPDFTSVRNAHNLDFTHQDPLRSTVQYVQAWSVMEFMVADPRRGAAFSKLLKLIKDAAHAANVEASKRKLKGEKYRGYITEQIYKQQYDLFTKAYGADVLKIEELWKQWIRDDFDKQVARNPELRYHRGTWHLEQRARFAKDAAQREAVFARAEALFQEALNSTPDAPEGYVGMGRLALERGDAQASGQWFGKAAELGTDNFEALLYGGIALIRSNKAVEAVAPLARAISQRPTHYLANYQYGLALAVQDQDHAAALLHLTRAADLRPDDRALPSLIGGVVHFRKGDLHQAKIHFLRAQSGMGGHALILLLQAVVMAANADPEAALLTLKQITGSAAADRIREMIEAGQTPQLGFGPNGAPGIVGVTIQ